MVRTSALTRARVDESGMVPRVVEEQRCRRCEEWKRLDHFGPDKRNKNGRSGICRQCLRPKRAESTARYRAAHLERIAEYVAATSAYHAAHMRAVYHADPESARAAANVRKARHRRRKQAQANRVAAAAKARAARQAKAARRG